MNRFLEREHAVSVIARTASDNEDDQVRSFPADIADPDALRARLDEVTTSVGPLTNVIMAQRFRGEGDAWKGELDVSVTASKLAIEHLRGNLDSSDGHSAILISSNVSRLVAGNQPVGYHVAKAALVQLARFFAVTLGPLGIRVNCVSPGAVLKDEARDYYAGNPQILDLYRDITPLGRMTSPDDVGAVVDFLCHHGSFITGQDVVVDGGLSLLWQESLARGLTDS